MKIAVVGAGASGSRLARQLVAVGHEVALSDADSEAGRQRLQAAAREARATAMANLDAVRYAEMAALAVPFNAVEAVLSADVIAALENKVLIDATNPLSADHRALTVGGTTSGAEQLAARIPKTHVVKAFSTLLAPTLNAPRLGGAPLLVPVAGDDEDAKRSVIGLARQLGFDAVDAGPLVAARYLEPCIVLLLGLAGDQGLGSNIGLHLARE